MKCVTPLFIFSLPRSGSTLLQRLIAMHSKVATESETWLLLPLFYLTKNQTGVSEYNQDYANNGIQEALGKIEDGTEFYYEQAAILARTIYSQLAKNGEKYFLDKTPRYHLIVDEIISSFPDAKIIFLWRNPLAVINSMLTSWGKNRWNLYRYKIDLYKGLENMVAAFEKYKNRSISIKYEDLLEQPEKELSRIMEYLELHPEKIEPENLGENILTGSMGDNTGIKIYTSLSKEPLDKWKDQNSNPVRRAWCRRYLNWIGDERLTLMGYDGDELRNQLSNVRLSPGRMVSDIVRIIYGLIYSLLDLPNIWKKLNKIRERKRIYPYS